MHIPIDGGISGTFAGLKRFLISIAVDILVSSISTMVVVNEHDEFILSSIITLR